MLIYYEDVLFVIALLVSLQKDKNITTYNKKSDTILITKPFSRKWNPLRNDEPDW